MARITEQKLEKILSDYADTLGITEAQRNNAESKYKEIGTWLNSGSFFKEYAPEIYAHGSFALGTVVRPGVDEEFDLDIAVQLTKGDVLNSPKEIKAAVNERLNEDSDDNPCLDADKKSYPMCYTLKFPKKFSMDVVPARYKDQGTINNLKARNPGAARFLDTAIDVVNKNEQWLDSNPKGYIKWFNEISKESEHKGVRAIMDSLEPLPANRYRSPLQKIVQILKRHAAEMFSSENMTQYKPPSIAITTLAALSYKKEYSLYSALQNFKKNSLVIMGDKFELENPANPGEWFSWNWEHDETKKKHFRNWLDSVDVFIQKLLDMDDTTDVKILNESFVGEKLESPYKRYIKKQVLPNSYPHAQEIILPERAVKFNVDIAPDIEVKVNGLSFYNKDKFDHRQWEPFDKTAKAPFPKGFGLRYTVTTDCPAPYKISWQVVNEPGCKDPRGTAQDMLCYDNAPLVYKESTLYKGNHYVRALVIKDGFIVAQKKVWVPIE